MLMKIGDTIEWTKGFANESGKLELIYTELQASGSSDYKELTMLLITHSFSKKTVHLYTRYVTKIIPNES